MLTRLCVLIAFLVLAVPARAQIQPDNPQSPAIRAIINDPAAEAALWRRLERDGAPIIEPSLNDPDKRLVTFVWRDDHASAVGVITPLSLIDIENGRMTRAAGTSTWYRTIEAPLDAVFAYRFAPNDSFTPFNREPNFMQRLQTWRVDPDNPARFNFGMGPDASVVSLTPDAHPLWVARRDVRPGRMTEETVASTSLGGARHVQIYEPRQVGDGPRSLLILMDGASYISLINAPTTIDNLIASHRLPNLVVAFVDAGDDRDADFRCNPAWGRFLADELVPRMRAQYRAGGDAPHTIVGGYSLGGLAAGCAAIEHPDAIGNVLAQSGSFYSAPGGEAPEWVARALAARPRANQSWYVEIGQLETSDVPSRDPSMLTASRHVRDVLTAKGYRVRYHEYFGGHEQVAWRSFFGSALLSFFADQ